MKKYQFSQTVKDKSLQELINFYKRNEAHLLKKVFDLKNEKKQLVNDNYIKDPLSPLTKDEYKSLHFLSGQEEYEILKRTSFVTGYTEEDLHKTISKLSDQKIDIKARNKQLRLNIKSMMKYNEKLTKKNKALSKCVTQSIKDGTEFNEKLKGAVGGIRKAIDGIKSKKITAELNKKEKYETFKENGGNFNDTMQRDIDNLRSNNEYFLNRNREHEVEIKTLKEAIESQRPKETYKEFQKRIGEHNGIIAKKRILEEKYEKLKIESKHFETVLNILEGKQKAEKKKYDDLSQKFDEKEHDYESLECRIGDLKSTVEHYKTCTVKLEEEKYIKNDGNYKRRYDETEATNQTLVHIHNEDVDKFIELRDKNKELQCKNNRLNDEIKNYVNPDGSIDDEEARLRRNFRRNIMKHGSIEEYDMAVANKERQDKKIEELEEANKNLKNIINPDYEKLFCYNEQVVKIKNLEQKSQWVVKNSLDLEIENSDLKKDVKKLKKKNFELIGKLQKL